MKKSIRLIAFFLTCSLMANAQNRIDFLKVNDLLEPAVIAIGDDTFSYKKISPAKLKEMRGWAADDYLLNDQYKKLSRDIDYLETCLSMVAQDNSRPVQESMLLNFRNIIDDFKEKYPRFEVRSYELIYWDAKRQMGTAADNEELDEIKRKKRESAQRKYEIEKKKAQEAKEEQAVTDKKMEDSLEAKTMYTVEENGTEYEIGYRKEYLEQMGYKDRNRLHEYLCRFLGHKYYWVLNIPKALMTAESFNLLSAELGDNDLTIKMGPHFRYEHIYGKFQIKAKLNKEGRVTSMVITGNKASLTHLFLWFWPPGPGLSNTAKLNANGVYIKGMFVEDVVFNRGTSTITIRPSASIKMAGIDLGQEKTGNSTKTASSTKTGNATKTNTAKPNNSGSSGTKMKTVKGASSGF
jgi:hypothetical protein